LQCEAGVVVVVATRLQTDQAGREESDKATTTMRAAQALYVHLRQQREEKCTTYKKRQPEGEFHVDYQGKGDADAQQNSSQNTRSSNYKKARACPLEDETGCVLRENVSLPLMAEDCE
jgi:hypothetical protein